MAIFFTRDNLVLAFPLLAVCSTYVRKIMLVICVLSHGMEEPMGCMYLMIGRMMIYIWHSNASYTLYLCTAALKLILFFIFSHIHRHFSSLFRCNTVYHSCKFCLKSKTLHIFPSSHMLFFVMCRFLNPTNFNDIFI
jgi:hypothetical protein